MFKKTLCIAALLAALVPAWAAEWMTDLEAAKAKAAAENKAVLIDFTGSDWCGWCIRLRKQVLDTPAFEAYAKDKFVLMEVDVPQNPKFDKNLRARNQKICEDFGVAGFPTLLVITPQGDVVGGFSGFKSSVTEAAKPLDAALAAAGHIRQAESQQGAEKLASLVKAYNNIPEDLQPQAAGLRQRIIQLDPQDTSGIGRQQRIQEQREAVTAAIDAAATPAEACAAVDKALETAEPENKPGMLQLKFQIMLMNAATEDEVKAAAVVGRSSLECDPAAGPKELQKFDASFAKPAEVLKRLQLLRSRRSAPAAK
jgi:thiol-disulfide isomerase/thioredoxin